MYRNPIKSCNVQFQKLTKQENPAPNSKTFKSSKSEIIPMPSFIKLQKSLFFFYVHRKKAHFRLKYVGLFKNIISARQSNKKKIFFNTYVFTHKSSS